MRTPFGWFEIADHTIDVADLQAFSDGNDGARLSRLAMNAQGRIGIVASCIKRQQSISVEEGAMLITRAGAKIGNADDSVARSWGRRPVIGRSRCVRGLNRALGPDGDWRTQLRNGFPPRGQSVSQTQRGNLYIPECLPSINNALDRVFRHLNRHYFCRGRLLLGQDRTGRRWCRPDARRVRLAAGIIQRLRAQLTRARVAACQGCGARRWFGYRQRRLRALSTERCRRAQRK